jgi:alpha-1,2-mannosyltransferase
MMREGQRPFGQDAIGGRLAAEMTRLGPMGFALLLTLAAASLVWLTYGLGSSLWQQSPALVNAGGAVMGRDFVAVWSAAGLALAHHPAAPYDYGLLGAAEQQTIGAAVPFFVAWYYPPSFLLLVLPLAVLPYLVALALWLGTPLLAFLRIAHRLGRHPLAGAAVVLFPGTAQCLISGQNGILSALLLTSGLISLERRPVAAGVCFGLLGYKPQMAVAVLAALLFGRYWRSLACALSVMLVLALASLAVFGIEPWFAFLKGLRGARVALETGQVPWERMATIFAAARLAGAGVDLAYWLQTSVTVGVLAVIFWAWRQRGPLAWRAALLATAIPLTTPYAYDYDLVVLLLPMGVLMAEAWSSGLRRGEIALIAVTWLSPVAGWLFAASSHLLLTPLLLLLLLAVLSRRLVTASQSSTPLAAAS